MNERTFRNVKGRELQRFRRALDRAIDDLVAVKYDQRPELGEYRQYVATCNYVRNLLQGVDLLADKALPLFDRRGERSTWEVYLSGLRKLCREMPESYLFRFVLPLYGLEDFQTKVISYSNRWLDGLHAAHKFFAQAETYLNHLTRGEDIAAEYQAKGGDDLARLYASLKTWESEAEVASFVDAVAEFLDTTFEVIIAGPVQLYLMLGRDTFLLLFKTLTVGKTGEIREGDREYGEIMAFHDYVYAAIEKSETLAALREISGRAAKLYADSLREETERLRGQLPTQDMKRSFLRRYEAGVLFRQGGNQD